MYLPICLRVLLLAGILVRPCKSSLNTAVELKLHLQSSGRTKLNPRFLSVTIDASLASEPKYIAFLGSQKLITLTKGLSPAYLRFGGTKSDFLLFDPQKNVSLEEKLYWDQPINQEAKLCDERNLPPFLEDMLRSQWPAQEQLILKDSFHNKFKNTTLTKSTMDLLYRFANCSGLHLIFGLNALLRKEHDEWDSSNAKLLIDYCTSSKYNLSWELGNEPNSFRKKSGIYVDGYQLGKDFLMLHELLSNYSRYRNSGLFGPDIGQPKKQSQKMLQSFLKSGGKFINSVTWHHYYVNGQTASKEDFLSADILDTLIPEVQTVFQIVDNTVPGKLVWLGETSSAYGGGSPGLSNTFIDGFISNYKAGDVTLHVLNVHNVTQEMQLPSTLSGKYVDEYLLEPFGDDLLSRSVLLNGQLLKMVDDKTLPTLHGKQLEPGSSLVLPAFRFGFFVIRNAEAPGCL
ncbi:heparanase isoform X2 [Bombina bombina]|uniref:heparanase isoform X2 n=1 Tax=Bombina bombina TaxID=8345 RepID=UPI00235A9A7F|nr:heparanase isoform X2 [Bombina bombina]